MFIAPLIKGNFPRKYKPNWMLWKWPSWRFQGCNGTCTCSQPSHHGHVGMETRIGSTPTAKYPTALPGSWHSKGQLPGISPFFHRCSDKANCSQWVGLPSRTLNSPQTSKVQTSKSAEASELPRPHPQVAAAAQPNTPSPFRGCRTQLMSRSSLTHSHSIAASCVSAPQLHSKISALFKLLVVHWSLF